MMCATPALFVLALCSARAVRDDSGDEDDVFFSEATSGTATALARRGRVAGMDTTWLGSLASMKAAEARTLMVAGDLRTKHPNTIEWPKLWVDNLKLDPKPACVGREDFGFFFKAEANCSEGFSVVVKEQNIKHTAQMLVQGVAKEQERKAYKKAKQVVSGWMDSEARIMKKFNDQRIVRLYDYIRTDTQAYFLTEYLPGGELNLLNLNQQNKLRIFADALGGVVQMHKNNVAHLDLNPENILLTSKCTDGKECHAKITGFGRACEVAPEGTCKQEFFRRGYAAPELWEDKSCQKSDTWALGILLYEILYSNNPIKELFDEAKKNGKYEAEDEALLFQKCTAKFAFKPAGHGVKDTLLARMLEKDPKNRWTAERALEQFKIAFKDFGPFESDTKMPPPGCEWLGWGRPCLC